MTVAVVKVGWCNSRGAESQQVHMVDVVVLMVEAADAGSAQQLPHHSNLAAAAVGGHVGCCQRSSQPLLL